METTEWIVLVVVLLVALAVAGYFAAQARKRKQLQSTFGREYDRTVETRGGRRDAERELAERTERRKKLDIRPLPADERQAFAGRWRAVQEDFVDRPGAAVRQADELVGEVMQRRGYPVDDFDQMARDVSVDHGDLVQDYRAAHDISELNDREQASTEQLRQAMVHYRALFTDLLAEDGDAHDDRRDDHDDDDQRHGVVGDRDDAGYDADRAPYDEHRQPREGDREAYDEDRAPYDEDRQPREGDREAHDEDRPPYDEERVRVERGGVDVSRTDSGRVEPGGLHGDRPRRDDPRG